MGPVARANRHWHGDLNLMQCQFDYLQERRVGMTLHNPVVSKQSRAFQRNLDLLRRAAAGISGVIWRGPVRNRRDGGCELKPAFSDASCHVAIGFYCDEVVVFYLR